MAMLKVYRIHLSSAQSAFCCRSLASFRIDSIAFLANPSSCGYNMHVETDGEGQEQKLTHFVEDDICLVNQQTYIIQSCGNPTKDRYDISGLFPQITIKNYISKTVCMAFLRLCNLAVVIFHCTAYKSNNDFLEIGNYILFILFGPLECSRVGVILLSTHSSMLRVVLYHLFKSLSFF